MRLIDADKILEYLDEETYSTNRAFASAIAQSLVNEIITPQPTVNAIVIPPNATNGDVIKAMFPEFRFGLEYTYNVCVKLSYHSEYDTGLLFDKKWWNAPYRKAEEE